MENNWIPVSERLPIYEEDGKKMTKPVFATDGKKIWKAVYFPYHFKTCEWENLDYLSDPLDYCDEIDSEYWLKEGWYVEYEHMGDWYEWLINNITHWMPLPELPELNKQQP